MYRQSLLEQRLHMFAHTSKALRPALKRCTINHVDTFVLDAFTFFWGFVSEPATQRQHPLWPGPVPHGKFPAGFRGMIDVRILLQNL